MASERYPGERRGLQLFLRDLAPAVEAQCGPESLLMQAIRRALRSSDLERLRHARQIFNHLPRDRRQRLSASLVRRERPEPSRGDLLASYSRRDPAPVICFEARQPGARRGGVKVDLRHELLDTADLTVLVRPGTLPTAAADELRRIAAMIDNDRRLLSDRFWSVADEDGDSQNSAGSS